MIILKIAEAQEGLAIVLGPDAQAPLGAAAGHHLSFKWPPLDPLAAS